MTKSKALTLLRSGIFNLNKVAAILYRDNKPANVKRMRLVQKVRSETLTNEEVETFERLLY